MHSVAVTGIYVNMTDISLQANPLFLREEELRQGIELLFYAYRDFTAEPDAILAKYKFGRAHHRAIYFVGRYPGTTVSELLGILRITKQSLSRVLGQLVREGFVEQRCIVQLGSQPPCLFEQPLVHGGAHPHSFHATMMPQIWH